MVLGCGAYCIGSSVEFDWSAVSCVRQCRASGYRAVVVNYNPNREHGAESASKVNLNLNLNLVTMASCSRRDTAIDASAFMTMSRNTGLHDASDRLYFEELSLERRVLDIYEQEQAWGLVVSVGGQIPQNLAKPLHDRGARPWGTSLDDIDRAEDRHKFSSLLDDLGVDQPPWRELQSVKDA